MRGLLKRNGEAECTAPNLVSIEHGGAVVTGGAHPVSVGVHLVGVPVQGGHETAGGAGLSIVRLGLRHLPAARRLPCQDAVVTKVADACNNPIPHKALWRGKQGVGGRGGGAPNMPR